MSNKTPQLYLEITLTLCRLQLRNKDNTRLSGCPINTNHDGICSIGKARIHFHSISCCLADLGRKFLFWQSLSSDSMSPQRASVCSSASSFNHNVNFFLESFKSKIKWAYCQTLCSPGELRGTISPVQFLETSEVVTPEELSFFPYFGCLYWNKIKSFKPLRIQWFHTVWPTLIYTFANAINIFPAVWLFWPDFHLPLSCPRVTINEKCFENWPQIPLCLLPQGQICSIW